MPRLVIKALHYIDYCHMVFIHVPYRSRSKEIDKSLQEILASIENLKTQAKQMLQGQASFDECLLSVEAKTRCIIRRIMRANMLPKELSVGNKSLFISVRVQKGN